MTGWRASAVLTAALMLLSACPSTPGGAGGGRHRTRAPGRSDLEGIELVNVDISPSAPAVGEYGAQVEHALTEVEQVVADALVELPLSHEPALSRMVRELATTTPDHINVPSSLTDGLMAWAGLVDPPPQLLVAELGNDRHGCHRRLAPTCRDALASLVEQVKASLPEGEALGFGVGVVGLPDSRTRMMVAVLEHTVSLRPMSVAVERGGSFEVAGRLLGSRGKPQVEIVSPRGRWAPVPTGVSVDGGFSARVECGDGDGAYQVEVLAEGTHGPEVTANFPVYCGAEPPAKLPVVIERLDPSVTPGQIARANFLYLNEEREQRGLLPLEWDVDAATVARDHSRDMLDNGFFGHRSPTTGDVSARFTRAGMQGTVIRENVARGYGPKSIHDSLMRSPGHRINILAADVTHVGVGVVVGEPETGVPGVPRPVFATQNFYRRPGAGAPTRDLGPNLQARVDARRREQGLAAVQWDPQLGKIAQRRAEAIGRGRPPPADYDKKVFALGYVAVESHQISSIDFEALAGVELWKTAGIEAGLGVVRIKGDGDQTFLVIVLVAER